MTHRICVRRTSSGLAGVLTLVLIALWLPPTIKKRPRDPIIPLSRGATTTDGTIRKHLERSAQGSSLLPSPAFNQA